MKITAISDLHGFYPKLPGGDLLIVAGDLTASDQPWQYVEFETWLTKQPYKKKVIICGNHDKFMQQAHICIKPDEHEYTLLCDSGCEFEGLKIWGSPWTRWFEGVNPFCDAFMLKTEEELAEKFALIPDDIDILVTHGPPYGILDRVSHTRESVGSKALWQRISQVRPQIHCFGHIHEEYGKIPSVIWEESERFCESFAYGTDFYNCSHVDRGYKPVNSPVTFELDSL